MISSDFMEQLSFQNLITLLKYVSQQLFWISK